MIKATIKGGEKCILHVTGNIIEVSAEIILMIDRIYKSINESNSREAELFREGIRDAVMYGPVMGNDPKETEEFLKNKIFGRNSDD